MEHFQFSMCLSLQHRKVIVPLCWSIAGSLSGSATTELNVAATALALYKHGNSTMSFCLHGWLLPTISTNDSRCDWPVPDPQKTSQTTFSAFANTSKLYNRNFFWLVQRLPCKLDCMLIAPEDRSSWRSQTFFATELTAKQSPTRLSGGVSSSFR